MIKKIILYCFLIQLLLIIDTNYLQAIGKIPFQPKSTHIRYGFTEFGVGQVREYKFLDVPENLGFLNKFPLEELRKVLSSDFLANWNVDYRIFTSIEEVELALVERLDMSNLGMNNIIDSPLTKGPIGDNCWYQFSVGSIKFIRNNALVSITPNINNSSYNPSTTEWLARQIDSILVASEKFDNVNKIPAPLIESVLIVSELPQNWNKTVNVKVNATDPSSQHLRYRQYASALGVVSETGNILLSFNKYADSTVNPGLAKVRIWVWNDDFITSSIQKEIPF